MAWNGLDGLESFQMAWKVSRLSGNFLYFTKTFQVYKNFPGSIATLLPWFSASDFNIAADAIRHKTDFTLDTNRKI